MSAQLDIFSGLERVTKYQVASRTSRAAAKAAEAGAETLRGRIYRELIARGGLGATDEELQHRLEINPSTQRPRRVELVERGFVVDSGRTRSTQSGRQAVVWLACP